MDSLNNEEEWFVKQWRPAMAWLYMVICAFDFIGAPILFSVLQADLATMIQWSPLTMQAGGLFHMAMGAIIGISAWSRGQEKIKHMELTNSPNSVVSEPVTEKEVTP